MIEEQKQNEMNFFKKTSYVLCILLSGCQSETDINSLSFEKSVATKFSKKVSKQHETSTQNMYSYISIQYLEDYTDMEKNIFRFMEGPKLGLVSWTPCIYENNVEIWEIIHNIDQNNTNPTLGHSEDKDELNKSGIKYQILDFPCNMEF